MKTRLKRLLSGVLALAMVVAMMPTMGMSAFAADSVTYIDRHWDDTQKKVVDVTKTASACTAVNAGFTTLGADNKTTWYVVNESVTIGNRITVKGVVNLVLMDNKILNAQKGIKLIEGNTLNIYAQSDDKDTMGTLIATGDSYFAGIGGDRGHLNEPCNGGEVTINGGTVNVTGTDGSAGIGGGYKGNGGKVTINGGTVTATGGSGAGIGGGDRGNGGKVTINGGTVTAVARSAGAGIGGGGRGNGGEVTINGGTVTATAKNSAGIGGGDGIGGVGGNGGIITINGGTVNATGGMSSAGIGGGRGGSGGTITITGGTVTANGGRAGAGIGGGEEGIGGTVTITGGTVTATGGMSGAGIGGGEIGAGGKVTINGGTVTATGGREGAGIGGGIMGAGANVTINGGIVTATGNSTASIGAGRGNSDNGSLTLGADMVFDAGKDASTITEHGDNDTAANVKNYLYAKIYHAHTWDTEWTKDDTAHWHECLVATCPITDYSTCGEDGAAYGAHSFSFEDGVCVCGYECTHTFENGVCTVCGMAEPVPPSVTYIDRHWDADQKKVVDETKSVSDYTTVNTGSTTLGAANQTTWYVVNDNVTITSRITVNGVVNLILADGKTLTASKGITVAGENTLNIYGQSGDSGKLIATGIGNAAGIGGRQYGAGGEVTITGGTVTANGGYGGAGIGGGQNAAGGTVTITGGTVTANGGYGAAGIGGGVVDGAGGTVTINGGKVIAKGGACGAGIGGGLDGAGGKVTINGGTVTANGDFGAGIGGGDQGNGGEVTINGGTVEATSAGDDEYYGAGIGGGCDGEAGTLKLGNGVVLGYGAGQNNITGFVIGDGTAVSVADLNGAAYAVTPYTAPHTHTWELSGGFYTYECSECHETCDHTTGVEDGKCKTCGVKCKATADLLAMMGDTAYFDSDGGSTIILEMENGTIKGIKATFGEVSLSFNFADMSEMAVYSGYQERIDAETYTTSFYLAAAGSAIPLSFGFEQNDTTKIKVILFAAENAFYPVCEHDWSNNDGVCATCGYECDHAEGIEDGKCNVCGITRDYVSTIAMKNNAEGDDAIETDLSVTLPANTYYTEDMGTEADKAEGYVTTYVEDSNAGMDIDLYVWEKDKSIKEEALAEAKTNPVTYEIINGVHTAYYFDKETENGVEYKTLTYLFEDGNYIAELVFWFDLVAEKTDAEMNQAALEGAADIIASLTAAHDYQDKVCTKCGDTITYAASEQALGDNMTVTIGENTFIWDDFAADEDENYLGIFRQPDANALDFDYYKWDKDDKTLSEEAQAEVTEANKTETVAHDLTIKTIKGIAVATYLNNNDEGSKSITAIFDGGDYFAELVFFYADETEKAQAEAIINSVVGIFGVTYQKKTSRFDYGTPVTVSAGNDTSAKYNWYDVTTGERKLVATGNKYYFAVTKDVKVESEKVEEVKPVLNLTIGDRFATNPGANDGKETVVLTAQWAVPEGYTFKEGGIKRAYSTKAEGPISDLNALMTTNTSSLKTPNGTYNYTIKMAATAAVKNINAVAYLIYVDANGVDQYMTTDIMVSAPTK